MNSLSMEVIGEGLKVYQPKTGYRYGFEPFVMSRFAMLRGSTRVLDIGAGCGILSLLLLSMYPALKIIAVEIQDILASIAWMNVDINGLNKRMNVINDDIRHMTFPYKFDHIVCNPPYIPTDSLSNLPEPSKIYEPQVAFNAGGFGIDIFRRLINESLPLLKPNGILTFEIGVGQEKIVSFLLERNKGFEKINYVKDGENVRVVSTIKKK